MTIHTLRDDRAEEESLVKIEVRAKGVRVSKTDERRWYIEYARFAGNKAEAWSLTYHKHEAGLYTPRQARMIAAAIKYIGYRVVTIPTSETN